MNIRNSKFLNSTIHNILRQLTEKMKLIKLIKHVSGLYVKTAKHCSKKRNEDLNKWSSKSVFHDWCLSVEMIYRFNVVPIKIPTEIFGIDIDKH